MMIFLWMCAGSALLLSGFFVFKDWETQRLQPTAVTRFFQKHSPASERVFETGLAYIRQCAVRFADAVHRVYVSLVHRAVALVRTAFVVFGAHLIRIARGEHLLSESRIPSIYFKLLHRHKKNINGSEIPKGIAQPDIPRRVHIRVSDEGEGSASPSGQVE